MKFSFGKYKGREIKDIAEENPYYFEWCLTHCLNLNHEEYCEIHKYYSELDGHKIYKFIDQLFNSDIRDLEELFLGKYFKCNEKYLYIKKVTAGNLFKHTSKALEGQLLWVVEVVDANKSGIPSDGELVSKHHIWLKDLLDKCLIEVTKEEFIENLKSVTERIINKL